MDGTSLFTAVLSFAFVIGLIGAASLLLKRFGPEKFLYRVQRGQKKDEARMAVKEVLVLDGRRRLVRVARGGVEYILLLSANGEQVVETVRSTAKSATPTKGKKS